MCLQGQCGHNYKKKLSREDSIIRPIAWGKYVLRVERVFLESAVDGKEEGKKAANVRENVEEECHTVLIIPDRFNLRRWRREL